MSAGVPEPGRPGIATALGSAVLWLVWLALTALWTPLVLLVFLLETPLDRRRLLTGRTFRLGARMLIAVNPWWSRKIEGTIPPKELHPVVVVCNHESLADILIVGTLPWEMKWLSKRSIFRVPFLGWMMRLAGDVPVRRNDAESRTEAFQRMRTWVERGVSVMIFPEGTRSRTSELLPFRSGAFRIAADTGRPILPLAVSGTRTAIRKGAPWFGRARVTVRILDPVPTRGLDPTELRRLKSEVRAAIDAARKRPPLDV